MACYAVLQPKLFVGQLLPAVTKDELIARFGQYGTVVQCTPLYHHDTGKFKGCAMVLFQKWAEAETAMENENGSYSLSGDRPMIVKFADPSRRADGVTAGITPKKLFVGQVRSPTYMWASRCALQLGAQRQNAACLRSIFVA